MIISSRASSQIAGGQGILTSVLTVDELDLIAALLWATKLGSGVSPWRDAASALVGKIEQVTDNDFMQVAGEMVDPKFEILDDNGVVTETVSIIHVQICV